MRTTLTELEGLGVKLADSYGMPSITVGKKVTECYERAYGEKGEYAKTTESFPVCFEGLNLQPEWFKEENRDINPFDREYKNKYRRQSAKRDFGFRYRALFYDIQCT